MSKSRIEDVFNTLQDPAAVDLQEAIRRRSWTPEHIARITKMSLPRVRDHLARLEMNQRAHIVGWTPYPGCVPVWVKGQGESPPRPRGRSQAEHQEAYRQRCIEEGRAPGKRGPIEGNAMPGRSRELTYQTIEAARAAGPSSWFASLGPMPSADALP
jgi:hypothetical protein